MFHYRKLNSNDDKKKKKKISLPAVWRATAEKGMNLETVAVAQS